MAERPLTWTGGRDLIPAPKCQHFHKFTIASFQILSISSFPSVAAIDILLLLLSAVDTSLLRITY